MKFIVVMILASLILGCGSIHNNGSGLLNSKDGDMPNLVVGGNLWIPLKVDYKEIWLEKQVTLVVTNEATLSYRVIDKAEMEFIGTTKSPYDFFKSAFSGAADDIERSFIEGLSMKNTQYHERDGIEFYLYEKQGLAKIYVLAKSMSYVAEIGIKGNKGSIAEDIMSSSHLK